MENKNKIEYKHKKYFPSLEKVSDGKKVYAFCCEYRWLSNFWPSKIKFDGYEYDSVEAAYHSAKNNSKEWKEFCAKNDSSSIKKAGQEISLRDDWEDVKVDIMEKLIRLKFNDNQELKQKLLETGDMVIEEGNEWGDVFWGVDLKTKEGKNILGKIIMKVREEIKNKKTN